MSESVIKAGKDEGGRNGRLILLALVALFVMPLFVVAAMYFLDWRPGGASQGQLITPPQSLQLAELQTAQGKKFGAEQWKGKWSLVYIGQQGCDAACETQLHDLRQIHASLNKEIGRVQRVLLVPVARQDSNLAQLQQQYPDLVVLVGAEVTQLARQFSPVEAPGMVYLVDPLGNLMMRYSSGYQPKGLRKDLMRLLTYSWVG